LQLQSLIAPTIFLIWRAPTPARPQPLIRKLPALRTPPSRSLFGFQRKHDVRKLFFCSATVGFDTKCPSKQTKRAPAAIGFIERQVQSKCKPDEASSNQSSPDNVISATTMLTICRLVRQTREQRPHRQVNQREVQNSFSNGRPSRKNPAGIFPRRNKVLPIVHSQRQKNPGHSPSGHMQAVVSTTYRRNAPQSRHRRFDPNLSRLHIRRTSHRPGYRIAVEVRRKHDFRHTSFLLAPSQRRFLRRNASPLLCKLKEDESIARC